MKGEAQKSFVCEAVRAVLGILLKENFFDITTTCYRDVLPAAGEDRYTYEADAGSGLGTIAVVVRDVIAHSPRPLWEVIDVLFTVITGFPCTVSIDLVNFGTRFGTYADYAEQASVWVNIFVRSQAAQMHSTVSFGNAKAGRRWKQCMSSKMAYVDKLRLQEGRLSANLQIVLTYRNWTKHISC